MPTRERVQDLIKLVERGKYVQALQEFYADDASMQENNEAPRKGLKELVAHEQEVMASFHEIKTLPARAIVVDGDQVVINWVFMFTHHDGRTFRLDELAHQVWRGDKVFRERFFYDPTQQRSEPQGRFSE